MPKLCLFESSRADQKYVNPMHVRTLTKGADYTIIEFESGQNFSVNLPIEQVAAILDEGMQ